MANYKDKVFGFLSSVRWFDSMVFFIRLFVGIMMLTHGIAKITNYDMLFATFPDPIGWGSSTSLLTAIIVETVGSVFLIIGLLVRPVALGMALFMVFATFFSSPDASIAQNELAFMYMGIYVSLLIGGGGKYSLDSALFRVSENVK